MNRSLKLSHYFCLKKIFIKVTTALIKQASSVAFVVSCNIIVINYFAFLTALNNNHYFHFNNASNFYYLLPLINQIKLFNKC